MSNTFSNFCTSDERPLVLCLILLFLAPALLSAQSFDDGLKLYQQKKYKQAASVFSTLNSEKALLFAGKSYFGMGKYVTAKTYLQRLNAESDKDLHSEALYTQALANFQLSRFGSALDVLYEIEKTDKRTQLANDARKFYKQILDYLTINQRREAFQETSFPQVKYDIVSGALGKVNYNVAKTLYHQLIDARLDTTSQAMQKLSKEISDSARYAVKIAFNKKAESPNGTIYNIGVTLPSYSQKDQGFKVAQGLYYGYLLAANQFNSSHNSKKVFLRYQNTGAQSDSVANAISDLAWNVNVSAILGPLFSKPTRKMAGYAEEYEIPLIAPLANSDSLNIDNPYFYQANPTQAAHGRRMAQYAVNTLNMDTLAVITGKNSLGEISAMAFRDEAERLGAKVVYFFAADLEENGYDLSDYMPYFTTDPQALESPEYHHLDAVYAPFTGQAASTLMDLLLVDMNAMNSRLPVLGAQEWGTDEIPQDRFQDNRLVYFSDSEKRNQTNSRAQQFNNDFQKQFKRKPNKFSMIGYDVASFLFKTLDKVENPVLLKNALKNQPAYKGVINNIDFNGTHVNEGVKIYRRSSAGIQAAR